MHCYLFTLLLKYVCNRLKDEACAEKRDTEENTRKRKSEGEEGRRAPGRRVDGDVSQDLINERGVMCPGTDT